MHITINATPIRPGGGLTVVRGLVQSLREQSTSSRITVLTGNHAAYKEIVDLELADHVENVLGKPSLLRGILWQNLCLGFFLRKKRTDVLITFNHFLPNISCAQVVYHLNLRRFIRTHRSSNPLEMLKEKIRDRSAIKAMLRADANVFESQYLQNQAEKILGGSARASSIIYIGLPEELVSLHCDAMGEAPVSRRIVAITAPVEHKDNPTLLRTLAELVRQRPHEDWQLDILGGVHTSVWEPMKQLALQLNISDRITWHGFCDCTRMTEILRNALCLVSTSQLESFAMVALEAMARGCPPIVANCTSMPESIGNAGLLAASGDPTSFAQAVIRLMDQPELRSKLVDRGYHHIAEFRWSECGRQFQELIERLHGKSHCLSPSNKVA